MAASENTKLKEMLQHQQELLVSNYHYAAARDTLQIELDKLREQAQMNVKVRVGVRCTSEQNVR